MILAMTSTLPNLNPAIGFDQRQKFFHFRWHARSISPLRNWSIPAQRVGTAEEFGALCAFLCSLQAGT